MKKGAWIILLIFAACVLGACNGMVTEGILPDFPQSFPTSTSEGLITETEASEAPGSMEEFPVVSDAFHDYKLCQGIYGGDGMVNNFRIPKVNISSEVAEQTNSVIFDELYNKVYVINRDQAGLGIPAGMNYTWTEHEGIISILVYWQHGDLTGHAPTHYQTYNILKETGQLLSSAELAGKFGLTEAEFIKLSCNKILEKYDELNSGCLEHENGQEYYWSNLEEILSDKSIQSIMPFLSEQGELCIVAMMHWITSGERYQCLLNVSGDAPMQEPRLLWTFPEGAVDTQCVLTQYNVYDQGKKIESYSFQYNEKQQLVTTKYSGSDDYSATLTYTYNSEGKLVYADCGEAWLYFDNRKYEYNTLGLLSGYSRYWGGDPVPISQFKYAYVYDDEGRIAERHVFQPDSEYVEVIQYDMYDESGRVLRSSTKVIPKEQYNAEGHAGLETDNSDIIFYTYNNSPLVLTYSRGRITIRLLDTGGETVWSAYLGDAKLEYDELGRIVRAENGDGRVFEMIYDG